MIVDTGDISDHGTKAENKFVEEIGTSRRAVRLRPRQPRLQDHREGGRQAEERRRPRRQAAKTVAGLQIYGLGDPRFTPDKTVRRLNPRSGRPRNKPTHLPPEGHGPPTWSPCTTRHQRPRLLRRHPHDPRRPRPRPLHRPAPHGHPRSSSRAPPAAPACAPWNTRSRPPSQASVLYFDRETKRLQAWDDITLGGLGEQSVQIQRHVEPDAGRRFPRSHERPVSNGNDHRHPSTPRRLTALASGPIVPYASEVSDGSATGQAPEPPSSSGLGHRPFKAAARVRIPLGARRAQRTSETVGLRPPKSW